MNQIQTQKSGREKWKRAKNLFSGTSDAEPTPDNVQREFPDYVNDSAGREVGEEKSTVVLRLYPKVVGVLPLSDVHLHEWFPNSLHAESRN